ncbi:unnamed protein product, partial [Rotaria sp. Silwood2]
RVAIPRLFSTVLHRANAINKDLNYRFLTSRRQPITYKAYHTIDDTTRDKFPFLPAPINSLQQIKSSTIEQIQTQAEQTHYA